MTFSISADRGQIKKGGEVVRKCVRCGTAMKEGCDIKIEGGGNGIVLAGDAGRLFGGRLGKPKVAICPACGEVSLYLDDISKLK